MGALRQNSRTAFTLMELLVAVGIIAVLTLLAFSSFSAIRNHGMSAKCMSNMRQIFAGIQGYIQENNNRLMQRYYPQGGGGYDELLASYLPGGKKNLFTCPGQLRVKYPSQPGYGLNWYYDNQSIFAVGQPGRAILLAETIGGGEQVGSHRADRDSKAPGQLDKLRHGKRANYLFFDGHVESLKYDDTRKPVDTATDDAGHQIPIDMWGVDHNDHKRSL
jgi:prepilin-type processing-associated H-X9-DG protein/prepilin-type N-terminal cleavage/methylation domain-containing protein